jgi:hypothetical protein
MRLGTGQDGGSHIAKWAGKGKSRLEIVSFQSNVKIQKEKLRVCHHDKFPRGATGGATVPRCQIWPARRHPVGGSITAAAGVSIVHTIAMENRAQAISGSGENLASGTFAAV